MKEKRVKINRPYGHGYWTTEGYMLLFCPRCGHENPVDAIPTGICANCGYEGGQDRGSLKTWRQLMFPFMEEAESEKSISG